LALRGSKERLVGPEPIVGPAGAVAMSHGLLSKKPVEVPDGIIQKESQMSGLLTGHCQMRRHMHILGLSQVPECRLCLEDEETIHVLTQCPTLATIRKELWGKSVINPLDIQGTRSRRLCGFVRATKLEGY